MLSLRTLLGNPAHLRALKDGGVTSPLLRLDFADVAQPHTAFKPFVRDLAFDCGELAIVTFLQAQAYGKLLVLLPVAVSSRFHHGSIFYNADFGALAPGELEGQSVAVRTYSQTTGVWVRGILKQDYGVDHDRVDWVTFDDSHLAEYRDPPNCRPAAPGSEPDALLAAGEVAAAIPISLASRALQDPKYRTLIPDADLAARAWFGRHRTVPVNHYMVVRRSLLEERPDAVRELLRMLAAAKARAGSTPGGPIDMLPFGIEENRRSLEMVIRFAVEQHLISRAVSVDELFEDIRGLMP